MTSMKICPACQKELPILAVRCKFCGFKQPLERDGEGRIAKLGTRPMSTISSDMLPAKRESYSTIPPVAPRPSSQSELQPYATAATSATPSSATSTPAQRKKTSALSLHATPKTLGKEGGTPSPGFQSGTPKAPAPATPNKNMPTSGKPRHQTVMGFGRAPAAEAEKKSQVPVAAQGRPSVPPPSSLPPASRPSSLPPPSLPPPPKESDDSSLIMSLDDDSQLILLESEPSATVELDVDNLTSEVATGDTFGAVVADSDTAETLVMTSGKTPPQTAPLLQKIMTAAKISIAAIASAYSTLLEKGKKTLGRMSGVTPFLARLGSLPKFYWGIAAVVLVAILLGVFVFRNGSDTPEAAGQSPETKNAPPNPPRTAEINRQPDPSPRRPTPGDSISGDSISLPGGDEPAPAARKCVPFSQYGDFLWKPVIASAIQLAGGTSVCDLMGRSPATIGNALKHQTLVYHNGYDGLEQGSWLEVALQPNSAAQKEHPHLDGQRIEFLFFQNRLYRIVLNYGAEKKIALDFDKFESAFKRDAGRYSFSEYEITAIDDGEIRTELITPKGGVSTRQLVLSDLTVGDTLAKSLDTLWKARQLTQKGVRYVERHSYAQGLDAFQDALEVSDVYGPAWAGRAEALLHLEDFTGAASAAEQGIKVSFDPLVKAKSQRLLAVVALQKGDRKLAIAHLEQALAIDPQNTDARLSLSELQTGKYSTSRVALTAARMSCLEDIKATPEGVLALCNFSGTEPFFAALKIAKQDVTFESQKREFVSRECD